MEIVKAPLDYIGVNLYGRRVVAHDPQEPNMGVRVVPPREGKAALYGLEHHPEAMHQVLTRIWSDYRTPLWVTETGYVSATSRTRTAWSTTAGRSASWSSTSPKCTGPCGRDERSRLSRVDDHRQRGVGERFQRPLRSRILRPHDPAADHQEEWLLVRRFDPEECAVGPITLGGAALTKIHCSLVRLRFKARRSQGEFSGRTRAVRVPARMGRRRRAPTAGPSCGGTRRPCRRAARPRRRGARPRVRR